MSGKIQAVHILALLTAALCLIAAATGIFFTTGGEPYQVSNQYGDLVRIYGDGIYAHDSYFRAPIFRGTDFIMLIVAVPLLLTAVFLDLRKGSSKSSLLLVSVLGLFLYYAASLALGVTYNALHLVYIAQFSASFFGFVVAMVRINYHRLERVVKFQVSRGIYIFLVLTGTALFAAWLPDILSALRTGGSLALIEVYTTEITYVIDMGLISPLAFLTVWLLQKRRGIGYVLLSVLLMLCFLMGLILPAQTVFQMRAGINLPLPVLISKVGSFVLLAVFALCFMGRLFRSVQE